jgi:hypothetical protein
LFRKIISGMATYVIRPITLGCLTFLILSGFSAGNVARAGDVTIIDNIKEWQHPVKDVLSKHRVVLYKVGLHNKTYPIFYVKFPYDPWLGHNDNYFKPLYYETLKANGFWDYAFIDRSSHCRINITWDKKTKTLTESVDDFK